MIYKRIKIVLLFFDKNQLIDRKVEFIIFIALVSDKLKNAEYS